MNGKTHMVVGGLTATSLLVTSIAFKQFTIPIGSHNIYPIVTILPAILSSLGPDMDMVSSISGRFIRKALNFILIILSIIIVISLFENPVIRVSMASQISILQILVASSGLLIFLKIAKHRKQTHCGLAFLLISLPLIWHYLFAKGTLFSNFISSLWLGIIIGWFSHLVIDSFNRKGVPWLYPFISKRYYISTVVTGSHEETIFKNASIILFLVMYAFILVLGTIV